MNRQWCRMLAAAVSLAVVCTTAVAQPSLTINPFKWCQPWAPKLAAQQSTVLNCDGTPIPGVPVAFDDWICTKNGPITRVVWWGTVCNPIAGIPPPSTFYIAVWSNNPNPPVPGCCSPLQKICGGCVQVTGVVVGLDCRGNRVYKYSAKFPCQFTQAAGTHYWLQISEVLLTPTIQPRWCWSEHRNIKNCNAVQAIPTAAGVTFRCPLLDPCDNIESDLAFCLYSRSIIGTVTPSNTLMPHIYHLWLLCPQTGEAVEKHCIMPSAIDSFFDVFFEAPDGMYNLWMGGMATPGSMYPAPIMLMDGMELDLGEWRQVHGNSDADLDVDFSDIIKSLSSFGAMGPMPPMAEDEQPQE